MTNPYFLLLLGLSVALAVTPLTSQIARRLRLIDQPSARKRHIGAVPLAGGMTLLVALAVALPWLLDGSSVVLAIAVLGLPMLLLGAVDDRFDLPARLRLVLQLAVAIVLTLGFGVSIQVLDGIVGATPIVFGTGVGIAFTCVCVCGVLNATNMSDGVDGLLGTAAAITLAALGFMAWRAGMVAEAGTAMLLFGALLGYLTYNLGFLGQHRQIFLGDAGSMLVGFVLVVLLIALSQGPQPAITPTSAGWLLGLPLIDTVSVMVRRVWQRRSPFSAGRDHMHHILLDLGFGKRSTLLILASVQLLCVSIGLLANLNGPPQAPFFWLFVAVTVAQLFGITAVIRARTGGQLTALGIVPGTRPRTATAPAVERWQPEPAPRAQVSGDAPASASASQPARIRRPATPA